VISRVADACFWLGRYLERTDATARILTVLHNLVLDGEVPPEQAWRPVMRTVGEEPRFLLRFGAPAIADGETVQRYMTWDDQNPSCLRASITKARENTRSIREVVSLEVWETINELYLWLGENRAADMWRENRFGFFTRILRSTSLCQGLLAETMLHDKPLHFVRLGTDLERAAHTVRMLDEHHRAIDGALNADEDVETALWLALLRASLGFEPFMKLNHGLLSGREALLFLLGEPRFPGSVRHALSAARDRLERIRPPEDPDLPGAATLERLRALDAWVAGLSLQVAPPADIHAALGRIAVETAAVCDGLGRELFAMGPATAAEARES
jgi:uncharacterized alpha-E superfamily protein